ncbi:MAG: DUF4271 domain-containing protein [Flavobacteriaceae bacterium]
MLFISLVVLAFIKYLFGNKFLSFMILPFNNKYIVLNSKKGRQLLNWFHILFTLFQLINFSLFAFLIQKTFWTETEPLNDQLFFLAIIGLLILFQLIKTLLQFSKGFVFNTTGLISDLLFHKTSYFNYSSLVMFVSNVVLIYILKDSKTIIYVAIILIIFINAIGLINVLKNYQKAIIPHFFYFILYLCTLEIAPLIIIGSYLKD